MNRPQNFQEILSKFPDAKQSGGGWIASCPLPGHETPDGHITLMDAGDKVLITCQGGKHTYNDFCAAWGYDSLAYSDNGSGHTTYGYKPKPGKKIVEAYYIYVDVNGNPLFRVVRTCPKGFYQQRLDGNGKWINNMNGINRTLYHLDELPATIEKGTAIFIVEGEKDVDRLRSVGLKATCNSGGAPGKWLPQYTAALIGADVVIIPDKDKTGHDHVQHIAQAITGTAGRVRVLDLPGDGKDVSDWLDNGGTVDQLKILADTCPTWTPAANSVTPPTIKGLTVHCMKDIKAKPVNWLWKPYIPLGKITSIEGDPGIAKTYITLAIATAMSLGQGLPMQIQGEPCNVLMASAEDGYADTFRPRLDGMGANHEHIFVIDDTFSFDDVGFAQLEIIITTFQPKLLVIDPLQAYLGAGMDFHRANETRPVLARLAKLAESHELAVLVVRHLSKGSGKAIYRGIGSIDFTAACRSVLMAGCDPENPAVLAIVHIKSNLAKKGPSQGYELRDDNFYWTGESAMTADQIMAGDDNSGNRSEKDGATEFLRDELANGPVLANNVYRDAEGAGISKRTLNRAKKQMGIITGRMREKGKSGGGGYWTWQLPTDDLQCHPGNLSNEGVKNTYIATNNGGNLSDSEANNLTLPKVLATYVSEKITPVVPPDEPSLLLEDDIEPQDSGDLDNDLEWMQPIIEEAVKVSNLDVEPLPAGLVTSSEAFLELWENKGRPGIELRAGEICSDLRKALESEYLPRNIVALNQWYIEEGGETARKKPSANLLEVSLPEDNNQDAYKEDIFGMTKEEALNLYEAKGKPIIHLSSAPEVNCKNLEIFFSSLNDRKPEQIEAVVKWLKENAK